MSAKPQLQVQMKSRLLAPLLGVSLLAGCGADIGPDPLVTESCRQLIDAYESFLTSESVEDLYQETREISTALADAGYQLGEEGKPGDVLLGVTMDVNSRLQSALGMGVTSLQPDDFPQTFAAISETCG